MRKLLLYLGNTAGAVSAVSFLMVIITTAMETGAVTTIDSIPGIVVYWSMLCVAAASASVAFFAMRYMSEDIDFDYDERQTREERKADPWPEVKYTDPD